MIDCPRCAETQLPNTLFCDHCGHDMSAPAPSASPLTLRCDFLDSQKFVRLPHGTEYVFGRADASAGTAPDVDLTPVGAREYGVSRRHARLNRHQRELYLEDLGSLNGTFVNGVRLRPNQRVPIQPGDAIRLGLLRLTFHFEE